MARCNSESPALKEILLKLYRNEKHTGIDHHLYEYGFVKYHIQSSASSTQDTYLSISTPLLSQGIVISSGLSLYTVQMVKDYCCNAVEIVEPAKEGYQLTLKIKFSKLPPAKKDLQKVVARISSVQSVIVTSQLKETLSNVNSQDGLQGMQRPIKLVYHPQEPFYIIKQTQKITAVFPMHFKDDLDVVIAEAFFEEFMDVGSSKKWAKAPAFSWSPIPPPELRGESYQDMCTNGGFVSFDISSRCVEGKRLDKIVWSLLNFHSYVKKHVKLTKGFIHRRMRRRMGSLVQILQKASLEDGEKSKELADTHRANRGRRYLRKLAGSSKTKLLQRKFSDFTQRIKTIRIRIRIRGCGQIHQRCLMFPKFSSSTAYKKLD